MLTQSLEYVWAMHINRPRRLVHEYVYSSQTLNSTTLIGHFYLGMLTSFFCCVDLDFSRWYPSNKFIEICGTQINSWPFTINIYFINHVWNLTVKIVNRLLNIYSFGVENLLSLLAFVTWSWHYDTTWTMN